MRINLDMLKTRHRERRFLQAGIDTGQPFVVDNTNLTRAERQGYIEAAKKEAADVAKKADLEDIMHAYKPRLKDKAKGGLGVGPKPGAIQPDSIELKIGALAVW